MTSHPSSSPSFVCRLVRWRAAWIGEARPDGGGWLARHLQACPECQRYLAAATSLEHALLQPRRVPSPAASIDAEREERIFAAIRPTLQARRARARTNRGWFALAATAAGAALVAVVVWQRGPEPGDGAAPGARETLVSSEMPVEPDATITTEAFGQRVLAALTPAPEVLSATPLEQEIAAVQADTRSALRFLALNFLPTPAEDSASERG